MPIPETEQETAQQTPEKYSEEWWDEQITITQLPQFVQDWAENEMARLKEEGVLLENYTLPDGPIDDFRKELKNKSFEDIKALLDGAIDSKEKFEHIYNLARSRANRRDLYWQPKYRRDLYRQPKFRYEVAIKPNKFFDLYTEAAHICPACREERLSGDNDFSRYLLATTDMSEEDVLDENKRRAAAWNLPEDAPYWNRDSNERCRLEFRAAQKLVPYFEQRVTSLLKEKGDTLTPMDFDTPEFKMLQFITPWLNDAILPLQCSPGIVQPDSINHLWFQEARKYCAQRSQEQEKEVSGAELDQMAVQYATNLAERSNKAHEFLHYCQLACRAPNQGIDLSTIVYVAAYWNQFIESKEANIFNRIPSEADMGRDLLNFNKSCEKGVLEGFDFTEINKLGQDLTKVCSKNPQKTEQLKQYAKDGTLFQSIQIKPEKGHLRATVDDSLYQAFGLTPPQKTTQQLLTMLQQAKAESLAFKQQIKQQKQQILEQQRELEQLKQQLEQQKPKTQTKAMRRGSTGGF